MKTQKFYKVSVTVVERYRGDFIVPATSKKEAKELVEKDLDEAGYCYDKVTDCAEEILTTVKVDRELDRNSVPNHIKEEPDIYVI